MHGATAGEDFELREIAFVAGDTLCPFKGVLKT
jgi:hypothetical protein